MPRYAIYYVPEADLPLAQYGMRAIGYDAVSGVDVDFHEHAFFSQAEIREMTESPRTYGFHATLKAPFELAGGRTEEELVAAAEVFAAAQAPVDLGRLRVKAIGSFVALTQSGDAAPMTRFAGDCVRAFEPFRAPLTDQDRARRMTANLTDPHRAYLDQWGYPYVFELFRFHMTLTGRLRGRENVRRAVAALSQLYADVDQPMTMRSIAIASQQGADRRFRVLQRLPLTGRGASA